MSFSLIASFTCEIWGQYSLETAHWFNFFHHNVGISKFNPWQFQYLTWHIEWHRHGFARHSSSQLDAIQVLYAYGGQWLMCLSLLSILLRRFHHIWRQGGRRGDVALLFRLETFRRHVHFRRRSTQCRRLSAANGFEIFRRFDQCVRVIAVVGELGRNEWQSFLFVNQCRTVFWVGVVVILRHGSSGGNCRGGGEK